MSKRYASLSHFTLDSDQTIVPVGGAHTGTITDVLENGYYQVCVSPYSPSREVIVFDSALLTIHSCRRLHPRAAPRLCS